MVIFVRKTSLYDVKNALRNDFILSVYRRYLEKKTSSTKAFIFVATTGRSGTESLKIILDAVVNGISFHEPRPVMVQNHQEKTLRSPREYYKEMFYKRKVISILRHARHKDYYAETNHLFIKTFATHAANYFAARLRVIHLVRDPVLVAMSFYRIDSIPGAKGKGTLYLLDPMADGNILDLRNEFRGEGEFKHNFYRCLWYWYEVQARVERFKREYPSIPVYEIRTEELGDIDRVRSMFEHLRVEYDNDRLKALVGVRSNLKTHRKAVEKEEFSPSDYHRKFIDVLERKYESSLWGGYSALP
jgi:hypothetical protein